MFDILTLMRSGVETLADVAASLSGLFDINPGHPVEEPKKIRSAAGYNQKRKRNEAGNRECNLDSGKSYAQKLK